MIYTVTALQTVPLNLQTVRVKLTIMGDLSVILIFIPQKKEDTGKRRKTQTTVAPRLLFHSDHFIGYIQDRFCAQSKLAIAVPVHLICDSNS